MTSLSIPQPLFSNTFPHNPTLQSPKHNITVQPARATSSTTTSTSTTQKQLSFKTTTFNTLYDTLGIPIGATTHDIKSAYRKLARICHPDVERSSGAGEEFMRIHNAYVTLSDPEKREDYDRSIFRRRRPLTAVEVCGGGGYGFGRNWETDQCW